jgi:hypothetical protein
MYQSLHLLRTAATAGGVTASFGLKSYFYMV